MSSKYFIICKIIKTLILLSLAHQTIGKVSGLAFSDSEEDISFLQCGQTKHVRENETIFIQSPNFNKRINYPNSYRCQWRFLLNKCSLVISCPEFKLNSGLSGLFCSDFLHIIDGKPRDDKRHRFCGNKGPNQLKLKHKEIFFSFVTSRWFNSEGFQCALTCINEGIDEEEEVEEEDEKVEEKPNPPPNVVQLPPIDCKCGFSNVSNRIVNGVETQVGELPWIVALKYRGEKRPFCSGALINSRYVLTAGHCITQRVNPLSLELILNEHNNQEEVDGERTMELNVESILTHAKYGSQAALDFDAALIKIRSKSTVDLRINPPICLPRPDEIDEDFAGQSAIVAGWGLIAEDGSPSDYLRKVEVKVLNQEACKKVYKNSITERMLCAYELNKDSCQGDSGSPLQISKDLGQDGKIFKQIGIVSWGYGCSVKDKPGVYSRVTELLRWIHHNTMEDGRYCSS